mgnify:FL=1
MATVPHHARTRPALLLAGFVLLSVIIHGVFLASRFGEQAAVSNLVQMAPDLQVVVMSSRGTNRISTDAVIPEEAETTQPMAAPKPQAEPVVSTPQRSRPITQSKPGLSPIATPEPAEIPAMEIQTAATAQELPKTTVKTATGETDDAAQKQPAPANHLRAQLRSQLARHFTYPRLARRMGWEGEVGLGLHIGEDGRLGNIHVIRSSGYKVLDENARSTLGRIGRITVASNMVINPLDTEIEVLYRLTE